MWVVDALEFCKIKIYNYEHDALTTYSHTHTTKTHNCAHDTSTSHSCAQVLACILA